VLSEFGVDSIREGQRLDLRKSCRQASGEAGTVVFPGRRVVLLAGLPSRTFGLVDHKQLKKPAFPHGSAVLQSASAASAA